jgi:hypothetical protein
LWIDTLGHLKYLVKCGDEGALSGLLALILVIVLALRCLQPLSVAGDCVHMRITAAVRAHLWFAVIDLLATHPPRAVRAILWFKMYMKLSLITIKYIEKKGHIGWLQQI